MIRKLREFQIGQVIRQEGRRRTGPKAGTPTMGGLLILTAALVPTLLWANLTNVYVWIAVVTTTLFGAVGFLDDYLKIVRHDHHGLRPRYKMGYQILIAVSVGLVLLMLQRRNYSTRLVFPVLQNADAGSRCVVPAVHGVRARRIVERRQPDRRPGRPGHQHVRHRGGGLHGAGLRRRQPRARRLPAPGALSAGGRADGLLRRAGRGGARVPSGTTRIRPKSSWATWDRWRWARRSAPSRF